jgi:hypothetical protein
MWTRVSITSLLLFYFFAGNSQEVNSLTSLYQPDCECKTGYLPSDSSVAVSAGDKVLQVGYLMSQISKTIVQGSCWDFVNEVYKCAGVSEYKKVVFRSKKSGPYAPSSMVKPGDWVYHINHQFKNIEHSAIFVCWKDFEKRIAITLSYAGMNKKVPAKYGAYSLRSIYSIFRPNFVLVK